MPPSTRATLKAPARRYHPPLIISDEEIDLAVDILGKAIADAAAGKVSDEAVAPYAGW